MNRYIVSLILVSLAAAWLPAQEMRVMLPRFPILAREDVQKELKLTEQQISKINEIIGEVVKDGPNGSKVMMVHPGADFDGMDADVAKLLNDKQLKRMKEVWLQITGGRAFMKDDVAKELGITKEQRTKMAELQQELMTQMREMAIQPGEALNEERLAELRKMQKDMEAKIEKLLTKEQQATWTTMKGAKFEMKTGKTSPK
jgi:Spy/CpxP family protein refolding chaperone